MSFFYLLNPKRQQEAWQFEVGKKVLKKIKAEEPIEITIDEPDDEVERMKFLKARKRKAADAIHAILWSLEQ